MKLTTILLFASAVLSSTILRADTKSIYSNFGDDFSYLSSATLSVPDGGEIAVPFSVPTVDDAGFVWALTSIEFAAYSTEGTQNITVGLWDTNGNGVPGTLLESLTGQIIPFFGGDDSDPDNIIPPLPDSAYLVVVPSIEDPQLVTNGEYWVSLSDSSGAGWAFNNTDHLGVSTRTDGVWGPLQGSVGQGALDVVATEVVPSPEPGTFVGLGSGLIALAMVAWRRKKQSV